MRRLRRQGTLACSRRLLIPCSFLVLITDAESALARCRRTPGIVVVLPQNELCDVGGRHRCRRGWDDRVYWSPVKPDGRWCYRARPKGAKAYLGRTFVLHIAIHRAYLSRPPRVGTLNADFKRDDFEDGVDSLFHERLFPDFLCVAYVVTNVN